LCYNKKNTFFTVELKVAKGNSVKLSPHQISFHVKHPLNTFLPTRTEMKNFMKALAAWSLQLMACGLKLAAWGSNLFTINLNACSLRLAACCLRLAACCS
jgi:hypothetical protein